MGTCTVPKELNPDGLVAVTQKDTAHSASEVMELVASIAVAETMSDSVSSAKV